MLCVAYIITNLSIRKCGNFGVCVCVCNSEGVVAMWHYFGATLPPFF